VHTVQRDRKQGRMRASSGGDGNGREARRRDLLGSGLGRRCHGSVLRWWLRGGVELGCPAPGELGLDLSLQLAQRLPDEGRQAKAEQQQGDIEEYAAGPAAGRGGGGKEGSASKMGVCRAVPLRSALALAS
jgi:hypothetical protein